MGEVVCKLDKKGEFVYWADKAQLKRLREAAIIEIEEKKIRAKGTGGRSQLPPIQDIIQMLPPDQQQSIDPWVIEGLSQYEQQLVVQQPQQSMLQRVQGAASEMASDLQQKGPGL